MYDKWNAINWSKMCWCSRLPRNMDIDTVPRNVKTGYLKEKLWIHLFFLKIPQNRPFNHYMTNVILDTFEDFIIAYDINTHSGERVEHSGVITFSLLRLQVSVHDRLMSESILILHKLFICHWTEDAIFCDWRSLLYCILYLLSYNFII